MHVSSEYSHQSKLINMGLIETQAKINLELHKAYKVKILPIQEFKEMKKYAGPFEIFSKLDFRSKNAAFD